MPVQSFKHHIVQVAFDAVHHSCSQTRTVLCESPSFDRQIFTAALPTDDEHSCNVVKSIASLSSVDQALNHRFSGDHNDVCLFCGECTSSVHHIIWECQCAELKHARQQLSHPSQQH
eukprot:2845287-Karenia_brevis.AAC.1